MANPTNRNIGSRLDEIGDRIEGENDPERRYVFMLFHDLCEILYDIKRSTKETTDVQFVRIDDLRDRVVLLEVVEKDRSITYRNFKFLLATALALVSTATGYSYNLVADMRDDVNSLSTIVPRIEKLVEVSRTQSIAINSTRELVNDGLSRAQQQDADNSLQDETQDDKLERLNNEVEKINLKKSVAASKSIRRSAR